MANNHKTSKIKDTKVQPSASKKVTSQASGDFLDRIDMFFQKRKSSFLYIGLFVTVLFSFLLFDIKVSPGGDDSSYILRAFDFIHEFIYPSFQGALYPLVLSPFVGMFGINLFLLKVLSLIFSAVGLYFFYQAFSGRLPQSVVTMSFLLLTFNYFILYFASQTYSESFFMMLQAIMLWYMAKNFTGDKHEEIGFKKYLILGSLLFLLTLTKNVAYIAVLATAGYFVLYGRWKSVALTFAGFFSVFVPYEILKRLVWKSDAIQFSSQGNSLMNKDFYNPAKGKEDFMGFVQRFLDNSNLYFSKHIMKFLGFRNDALDINPILTILVWAVILACFVMAIRRSRVLTLVCVYSIAICATSFIVLQAQWDQYRIIIIAFPYILLIILSSFYYSAKNKRFNNFQVALPLLAIIFFFTSFNVTSKHVKEQTKVIGKNLAGNSLYGLTPDWVNYIQMSKWAAKNTPQNALTAVRKADISFIYGQRKFYAITKVPTVSYDSLLSMINTNDTYLAVPIQKMFSTQVFADPAFRNQIVCLMNGEFAFGSNPSSDGMLIGIYRFSKEQADGWAEKIRQSNIEVEPDAKAWVHGFKGKEIKFLINTPDMLMEPLKKNNVRYIMLASLRQNPMQYNGNVINTLHRYMFMVQCKYPNSFRLVQSIGTEEPSELYEIIY